MTAIPTALPSARVATPCRKKSGSRPFKKFPHLVVQHNYHDHAQDPIFDSSEQEKQNLGGVSTPFPIRLYEMLSTLGADCDIISWQPHGRCFVVHKPDEFAKLLPQFFKLSKIASFQRQLNLYGFVRLTANLDKGGYYHERFLRGRPDLLWTIPRAKVKGTKVRAKSNPRQEPDFWSMEWVGEPSNVALQKQQAAVAVASMPATTVTSWSPPAPRVENQRNHSLSIVSESGDNESVDQSHSSDEEGGGQEDFFDRLLNDMFDSKETYDFDALQRRLVVPEF